MVEELKSILDLFGKLPNFTLEILGGFALYKIIIYLSTSGSVVYIGKLLIEKMHDAYTRPRPPKLELKAYEIKDVRLLSPADEHLGDVLRDILRNTEVRDHKKPYHSEYSPGYLYGEELLWLKQAVTEHVARVGYPGADKK